MGKKSLGKPADPVSFIPRVTVLQRAILDVGMGGLKKVSGVIRIRRLNILIRPGNRAVCAGLKDVAGGLVLALQSGGLVRA